MSLVVVVVGNIASKDAVLTVGTSFLFVYQIYITCIHFGLIVSRFPNTYRTAKGAGVAGGVRLGRETVQHRVSP